jgi:hypothetical protein
MALMALGVSEASLWQESPVNVRMLAYRRGSTLPKHEQARVESQVHHLLEERVRVQDLIGPPGTLEPRIQSMPIVALGDVESAAMELRATWNLGLDPISSVVDILEDRHVHVLEIDANDAFDGLSAVATRGGGVEAAAVVTRAGVPGDRQRLNLSHELGHLLLRIADGVDPERAAFRFGEAFLAPAETVMAEIGSKRSNVQLEEMLLLKERFGMSVQAFCHRLRDLEVISDANYRRLRDEVNRRGWKFREPLDLAREKPRWLARSVRRAVAEDLITVDDAERLLGTPIEGVMPSSLAWRQALLRLPIEERRRRLAEQAAQAASEYTYDHDWEAFAPGASVDR